jgi:Chaperone of endosialidase
MAMRFFSRVKRTIPFFLCFAAPILGQQVPASATASAIPRLVRFTGVIHPATSQPSVVVGTTFSIYRDQEGGVPLWSEEQNVEPDKDGNYTVLLGSTKNEGVPAELFSGEARWLGVVFHLQGVVDPPRVLLVSVPYALKAADAETLGGRPASAYAIASSINPPPLPSVNSANRAPEAAAAAPPVIAGTRNYLAMFTDSNSDLGNSDIYDVNGQISVGGTAMLGAMTLIGDVPSGDAAGMALYNRGGGAGASVSLDMYNTSANAGIPQAKIKALDDGAYSDHLTFWTKSPGTQFNPVVERMRITSAGNVGIGTQTPAVKLEVSGDVRVDGNLVVTGSLLAPGFTSPVIQAPADGSNNFSVGLGGLPSGMTGMQNTAIGDGALQQNTSGSSNTATGNLALQSNQTGNSSTANGYQALYSNTSGSSNTGTGFQALFSNTMGANNTANGYQALYYNGSGNHNEASGFQALYNNTGGYYNTASGFRALYNNQTGSNNIAIGNQAGYNVIGINNIEIGNQGGSGDNGVIRIGTAQSSAFIAGIYNVTTGNPDGVPVVVDSNGQLGTTASSRRYKEDIQDMGDASSGVLMLRPVTFRYKKPYTDGSKPIQYGLIAEEVAEVYPDLVARSTDGEIETVKYHVLVPMLLNELQKQAARIAALEDRLAQVEARLEDQDR